MKVKEQTTVPEATDEFQKGRVAFWQIREELLEKYAGQFVAIKDGQVIDSDNGKKELARRVYQRLGYVDLYFQKVEAGELRTFNLLSPNVNGHP